MRSIRGQGRFLLLPFLLLAGTFAAFAQAPAATNRLRAPNPIDEVYRSYDPGFRFPDEMSREMKAVFALPEHAAMADEQKKLSSEPHFFTLNLLPESARANALVDAGKGKEEEGQFKEAIEIYQKIIDDYPDQLFRVSAYGIFVPITDYCQSRLLGFPPDQLQFYRTKYDAPAREAFELARERNSPEALAQLRDSMLATSYGGQALKTLGFAALDRGRYLEALEYLERVWTTCPALRTDGPELALGIAFCRKMLGQGDAGSGLVGHWKLDETSGNKAFDASGFANHGTFIDPQAWIPGKVGGAMHFTQLPEYRSNCINVPAATPLNIGVGGADFSVAFWLNWESGAYPNTVFTKRGRSANDMLGFEISRENRVVYTLATENPTWETGASRRTIPGKTWVHVGFVKANGQAKLFLDGRLDLCDTLKAPALPNRGGVIFGHSMQGAMDDVRIYGRALLDREVAELAGTLGTATLNASAARGETPLSVAFDAGAAGAKAECFWEFGDGETARGAQVRHVYGVGGDYSATLTVTDPQGAVAAARTRVAVKWSAKDEPFAKRMEQMLATARYQKPPAAAQLASAPNIGTDDYLQHPPSGDPLGLQGPVWERTLPGSRQDMFVYTQPVVTRNSVIYRHKNILYCHSLLNGELRWKNDMGGRVKWQNLGEVQYPQEDVLVQDGTVFTPMFKGGPTLVALDEITGRLKWAYGPMVASTPEEANLRFETAPAGGPMTVYAAYTLDNIEGATHTDTEYGILAFDSSTGRIKWRRAVCSLRPGKFSAGFAVRRRNRIRSFQSPPIYAQGTVYFNSNAGALAALDALSGQVKWVTRYPYYESVHDSTRPFGSLDMWEGNTSRHLRPQFWYSQRPLLVDESLYFLPQDTPALLSLNRRTGKVQWCVNKPSDGAAYLMGVIPSGEVVLASSARGPNGGVQLLDSATGKLMWNSGDPVDPFTNPALKYFYDFSSGNYMGVGANRWDFQLGARPFLSSDGLICLPGFITPRQPGGFCCNLAMVSLNERTNVVRRRYLSGEILTRAAYDIAQAGPRLKAMEDLPHKNEQALREIREFREITEDTIPVNAHGPFLPFARVTFERHGTPFELRFSPRSVAMVYDPAKVRAALAGRTDPEALFARAELAMYESRLPEAADLMGKCLALISSEDMDFRAMVNQLLFKVHEELVRASIRKGDKEGEFAHCLGMSRTVTALSDEVETLFAVAQSHERRGDYGTAARQLQSVARVYGQYEYPAPEILAADAAALDAGAGRVIDGARDLAGNALFGSGWQKGVERLKGTLPVYRSAVTPLPRLLTIRAGELSAGELIRLQQASPPFAKGFEQAAQTTLNGKPPAEQIERLWEFPGTPTAQTVLDQLLADADSRLQTPAAGLEAQAELRRRLWLLADTARICGLKLPDALRPRLAAPPPPAPLVPLALPMANRTNSFEEARGTAWLALDRRDDRTVQPERLFLGGRVKKKFDNKFLLYCLDAATGEVAWKAQEKRGDTWFDELRLQGKGDEPGFSEAFVHGDIVVVHGMYDVLAFDLKDGRLRWRFEVPFAFEIKQAVLSGDLLVLAGQSETLALYLPTKDPRGEVAWQEKEEGDLYVAPYLCGDRLVSLRKAPANLTVRYRSTGRLMGRLALPDLSMEDADPLVENGPRELPASHAGRMLVISDGAYYLMIDVEKMAVRWKRLIDANDPTRAPALRFALNDQYFAVVKRDFDVKAIYLLSSATGEVLWHTDPKVSGTPQPIGSLTLRGDALYGILPHAGQGFYFAGLDCKTGKNLFSPCEQVGYGGKPEARLLPDFHGDAAAMTIKDRQDFELKAFDLKSGRLLHALKVSATGDFGEHGRVSATVQGGRLALFGKNDLVVTTSRK
jgi:outer membrane protein assembly factor BamB/tetratricopeptide (TPR) repeat protein